MARDAQHSFHGRPKSRRLTPWKSLIDPLLYWAERTPDAVYLEALGPKPESVTFQQALHRVEAAALRLLDRGIRHGSPVAIIPSNSIMCVLLVLAVARAGGRCILVGSGGPPARILQQVKRSDPRLTVLGEGVEKHPSIRGVSVEELVPSHSTASVSEQMEVALTDLDDPIFNFYTTGSTAASKSVMQSSYAVLQNISALAEHLDIRPGRRLAGVLPISFANGLQLSTLVPLVAGGTAVMLPSFNPFTYLQDVAASKANVASLVPSMLEVTTKLDTRVELPELDYFVSAAARLEQRTAVRTWRRLHKRIIQGYGLSETTNFSTLMPTGLNEEEYTKLMLDANIPPVGCSLPGVEVSVLDTEGNRVPNGIVGEVCMRGHSVMLGYEGNIEATEESFRHGWFHSGDLGRLDEPLGVDRPVLTLTGRIKTVAKIGGAAVSLEEIERIVSAIPGVDDVACQRELHGHLGERVRIDIVSNNVRETDQRVVLKHIGKSLSLPGQSLHLRHVKGIHRTANGKIVREDPNAEKRDYE